MSNETCPHCGARRTVTADKKRRHFECDTIYFRANSYERGYDCYERQIEQQAAEIERLKQALNSFLEVEESECRFDHHGHCQSHYLDPATDGCRVAKARKLL